jgi:penicillin-binding protein A
VEARIRHLGSLLIGLFVLVGLTLGYWQALAGPDLAARPSNPRVVEAAERVQRGRLLDRNLQPLATTEMTPQGARRYYGSPAFTAVTGYHSPRYGDSGLEAAFAAELRGERSPDPLARLRQQLLGSPTVGSDVVLTIDARVQQVAAEAMGSARGAVVALDPRSGAVLALVSTPLFEAGSLEADWPQLSQDPARPLFNRAVQATYPPGSTFKTLVAAAALDLGLVNPDQRFSCTQAVQIDKLSVDCRNHSQLPVLNFDEALAWSCNRTFALTTLGLGTPGPLQLGDDTARPYAWEKQGIARSVDQLRAYAGRFGFERPIPFELAVEPSRLSDPGQEFFPSLLAQSGFGQGQVVATPLQMAQVAATIANGGSVPAPYLVSEVRSPEGARDSRAPGVNTLGRAVGVDAARRVTRGLELGVEVAYARKAAIPGVRVAGKTGTAEVGGEETPDSWFIGFAPADNPEVAVAVVMENLGSGSDFATPVGQRVLSAALANVPGQAEWYPDPDTRVANGGRSDDDQRQ